ncbi:MAG TPA: aldo/keto reductase [Thermoleophilaceae bacterium]|nr:aldo/keto reductase [Thermoleophilaceae bacterium]
MTEPLTDETAGTLTLGGELKVRRLGFGAMRITGKGIWGPPPDPEGAKALLRRVVELGIDMIDTADSYGPEVSENLIREALHPYPDGLTIATKAGLERTGPSQWPRNGRPEHLREAVHGSLRRLGVERIDLLQLHAVDPDVPFEESLGALIDLRDEGKIHLLGLSNVTVHHLDLAEQMTEIASVQNRYNLQDRDSQEVLDACTDRGLAFIPWYPLATGDLAQPGGPLDRIAARHDATPSQIALAWLLQRSPSMLPIPGTSSIEHLEQNAGAVRVQLTDDDVRELDA